MKSVVRPFAFMAALLLSVVTSGGNAIAQMGYPNKPIYLVVPSHPGGGNDILARFIADRLKERLGWSIVVVNKPGAGSTIGINTVAKAPADGHTIIFVQTSSLVANATLIPKLPYDPLNDLAPVILVSEAPQVMVVATQSPYRTLGDLVAAAEKEPDQIMFASAGNGTDAMLAMKLFQETARIRFLHIPYQSSSQVIIDLMAGKVAASASAIPTLLSHIKRGKIRAIGVTSLTRVEVLPDIPTISEMGYKGFEAKTRIGLLAPAGTPSAIIERINTEVNRVLASPEVRERIISDGGLPVGGTPDEFAVFLRADIAKWADIIRKANIRIE